MCGLLLINKPKGITSFGVVGRIKKLTGEKHVGHTGTLDPMAEGVLPVLIGRATKLSDYLIVSDKCYEGRIRLGITTDTLDITGKVLCEKKVAVTGEEIDNALEKFLGEISQTPPMFSAIKKNGVRLYRLAREGKQIDLPARQVSIFTINRTSDIDEKLEFSISCRVSKGTYIRSLVRDIGEYLGTGATLTSLTRTKTADFDIKDCVPLDILTAENIKTHILPASYAVKQFDVVSVTFAQAVRFSNGGSLSFSRMKNADFSHGQIVRVNFRDIFLGLAVADLNAGELKYRCLITEVKE